MTHSPTNCSNNVTTSRREQPFSCSQNFSYAALRYAVSVVSVAAASVANEGLHPLWGSCCRPISPPLSFSVWFRLIHLPFFFAIRTRASLYTNCSTRLSALSRSRESSREFHTLSTGTFAAFESFFLFYRNQRGCLLFTQTQFHNCTSTWRPSHCELTPSPTRL